MGKQALPAYQFPRFSAGLKNQVAGRNETVETGKTNETHYF